MYVKPTACGQGRSAADIDGRALPQPSNRPGRPLISLGFSSKPTHKLTHFHIWKEEKPIFRMVRIKPRRLKILGWLSHRAGSSPAPGTTNSTRFHTMEAAHQNIQNKSGELTKLMQRLRQDSVTTEILDLISGSEAIASSRDGC